MLSDSGFQQSPLSSGPVSEGNQVYERPGWLAEILPPNIPDTDTNPGGHRLPGKILTAQLLTKWIDYLGLRLATSADAQGSLLVILRGGHK